MPRRRERPQGNRGAASWWLLLALVVVAAFGFYIWYEQNKATEPAARPIQVAEADSSGTIPAPDSSRPTSQVNNGFVVGGSPADTGLFIAPPPEFASSSSGPVANLLAYARRMRFDPSRGAEFALPVDEYGRMGRMVRLEPLANLRLLDSTAFAQGRVIARIRSDAAVPSMSLHNGENFVWVQGTLGQPFMAEVWSTSVVVPPKRLHLSYSSRPPAGAPADRDAFWLGSDINNRVLWIACGRGWCHS